MASVDEFVENPTQELLKAFSKEQLLKVAERFVVECSRQSRKECDLPPSPLVVSTPSAGDVSLGNPIKSLVGSACVVTGS